MKNSDPKFTSGPRSSDLAPLIHTQRQRSIGGVTSNPAKAGEVA
jgi:hypothetical protein